MTTPVKIDKASQLPKPKSKVKIFSDQNTLPKPKVKIEPEMKPKRGRKVLFYIIYSLGKINVRHQLLVSDVYLTKAVSDLISMLKYQNKIFRNFY